MSQLNITELKQQRAKIVTEMRAMQDRIDEDGKETGEDTERFARMEKDIRALEIRIEREERLQEEEAKLAKTNGHQLRNSPDGLMWDGIHYPKFGQARIPTPAEVDRRASFALQGWLMSAHPNAKITEEHVESAKYFGFDVRDKEIPLPIVKNYRSFSREWKAREFRVGLTTSPTGTDGGNIIPEGFVYALEESLLAFGGVRQVSDVIRTDTGNDLPWPTVNDNANKGEIIAEGPTGNIGASVDPAFGQVIYKAFKYSSKPILTSFELLQDSAFDLGARLGEMCGTRIGRIQNDHFTTGAGTTLPKGVVVCASAGKVAASATAIKADELIDLEHSVDPAYRPNASWMFHDQALAAIRKLKVEVGANVVGDYIWQPGLQFGVPDRILGYRYTVNQSMASTFAINAKMVLFGDFNKYKVRDVATIRLRRLDELYAASDQVAFVAFMRSDAQLLDAGTDPIKYLAMAAS